jgi:glycosyltransferase involved in cell wall biosynthesis
MVKINEHSRISENSLITVVLLCYNHEAFLKESLDSIFCQTGIGEFEVVIGDDCSSDGSLEIIQDYSIKYPNRVVIISFEKNVGLIQNYIRCIQAVKTKYFALLSGDDYWIDSSKLFDQIEFLEKNLDYSMVYTNYNSLNHSTKNVTVDYIGTHRQYTYTGSCRDVLIKGVPAIMNTTCCYRTEVFDDDFFILLNDELILAEDFPTFIWAGFNYKIHYLDRITTVYRVNVKSITNSMNLERRWAFLFSHIYIRKKILEKKNYQPGNKEEIDIYENRAILNFAFKTNSGRGYAVDAFEFLKSKEILSFSNRMQLFSIGNGSMNFFMKGVMFCKNKLEKRFRS